MRTRILSVSFLAVAGLGLAFTKLWASTMVVLGGTVTLSLISVLSLAKVAAGFYGVHLLP